MLSHHDLDLFLQQGGVVLLPNHHGAQQWQDSHGRWRCVQRNSTVVAAPAIHAIDLWLNQLWQTLAAQCTDAVLGWRVLSGGEEELLWQQLLNESPAGADLLNTSGTARQLREALRLLQLWQLSPVDVRRYLQLADAVADIVDDRILAWQWLQQFQQRCHQQHYLSAGGQLAALLGVLQANPARARQLLPPQLLWLGFDDPPPLYVALQTTLQQFGCVLQHTSLDTHQPSVSVQALADTAAECRAAATWAATILQHSPTARIGIICPQLMSLRPQLLRIIQQHVPVAELYCSVTATLAEQPFFNTALQLLALADIKYDSTALCQLLRSPHLLGAAAEADARTALELKLRWQGELHTQMVTVRELCADSGKPWHCPLLAQALRAMQEIQRQQRKPQGLREWLAVFQRQWDQLLDSEQLALPQLRLLRAAWRQWLDQLHGSASLFGTISREHALRIMSFMAQSCRLGNGRSNAAVRLLTPVETAGLDFTHLWVMQLQVHSWPGELRPNPCLPLKLQRELLMPSVDAALELQHARRQLQQWLTHTRDEVVFSHAAQVDELPAEPSPLLSVLAPAASLASALATTSAAEFTPPAALHNAFSLFTRKQLVLTTEPQRLPLPAQASTQGPGSLLTAQSACPFQAFAKHRLYATELKAFSYGLPASAVGELLHGALQEFWLAVRDSSVLASNEATVLIRLDTAVTNALRKLARHYPDTVTPRFQSLEQQRLLELLTRWLELEKQRRPFTVTMTEQVLQWSWQSLQLNLRLDRVDHTANGAIVIDYKSGKVATTDWLDERPPQPQLLLYQQALQQHALQQQALQQPGQKSAQQEQATIAGLLYAKLNLDKLDYAGITAADEGYDKLVFTGVDGRVADWQQLQQHWQQVLQSLAQEYLDGLVVVSPQSVQSCRYCHLPALCRIDELRKQSIAAPGGPPETGP